MAAEKAKASHPTFFLMAKEAVTELAEKTGSTVPKIQAFIVDKYELDPDSVRTHLKPALAKGLENETFVRPKGSDAKGYTGRFKLNKLKEVEEAKLKKEKEKEKAQKAKEKEKSTKVEKKPAAKTSAKKTPTKSPKTKASAKATKSPKKTTAKAKAKASPAKTKAKAVSKTLSKDKLKTPKKTQKKAT